MFCKYLINDRSRINIIHKERYKKRTTYAFQRSREKLKFVEEQIKRNIKHPLEELARRRELDEIRSEGTIDGMGQDSLIDEMVRDIAINGLRQNSVIDGKNRDRTPIKRPRKRREKEQW